MDTNYYSQKPRRSEFLWKKSADGLIILRLIQSQDVINLGPLGSEVFERCDGKTTIAEITGDLRKKYSHIPANHLEHDVYHFLHWLQSMGLVLIYWDDF